MVPAHGMSIRKYSTPLSTSGALCIFNVMKSPAPLFFLAALALYGLLRKQGGFDEDKVGLGGDSGDDAGSGHRWGWLRV
jgi:hypothetical protein